jgi:integrase
MKKVNTGYDTDIRYLDAASRDAIGGEHVLTFNRKKAKDYIARRRKEEWRGPRGIWKVGKTPKTASLRREIAVLHSAFELLRDEFDHLNNPFSKLGLNSRKEQDETKKNRLETWELQKLIDACNGCLQLNKIRMPLAIFLAVETGMRRSELLNLKWADIDWNKEIITVTKSKTDKHQVEKGKPPGRRIPLTKPVALALRHLQNVLRLEQTDGHWTDLLVNKEYNTEHRERYKRLIAEDGPWMVERQLWYYARHNLHWSRPQFKQWMESKGEITPKNTRQAKVSDKVFGAWTRFGLEDCFEDVVKRANLGKPWTFHEFRHEAFSRMTGIIIIPKYVAAVIGHALPGFSRVSQGYNHLNDQEIGIIRDILNSYSPVKRLWEAGYKRRPNEKNLTMLEHIKMSTAGYLDVPSESRTKEFEKLFDYMREARKTEESMVDNTSDRTETSGIQRTSYRHGDT